MPGITPKTKNAADFHLPRLKFSHSNFQPDSLASGLVPPYFFLYQSALIGVKLDHFSGRSSSAKIAVTGQTGTHAPQSMHSSGLM
jgi:hypothetical protein